MRTFKIIAALITVATWATAASAGLILDVRLADSSKAANVSASDVVHLQLWVKVSGSDGNYLNEGLSSGYTSFLATNDGANPRLHGNLGNPVNLAPWDNASQTGTVQELNADGDLDIGTTTMSTTTGWFKYRGTSLPIWWTNASSPAQWEVGTFTFTVGSGAAPGQKVDINAAIRAYTGIDYLRYEDGALLSGYAGVEPGEKVVLTVIPEPATLALLALGGLGVLLGRKRRS